MYIPYIARARTFFENKKNLLERASIYHSEIKKTAVSEDTAESQTLC